jgi:CRP/FNR family transcriptional regulator, cyclic AMP receptor protein
VTEAQPTPHALDSVAVFTEVPELLRSLAPSTATKLSRLRTPLVRIGPGHWNAPTCDEGNGFGLLVTRGVLLRRLRYEGRTTAELLGHGDLLQPWVRQAPLEGCSVAAEWRVLEPAELAVLDRAFALRVARLPQIATGLLEAAVERSRRLAFQQAASHLPGLQDRLAALLWMLADRWGRVTPEGVVVPIRLTHSTIAELVGAARPSVSTALKALERRGALSRRGGRWLLRHEPPPSPVGAMGEGRVPARPGGRARPSHPRRPGEPNLRLAR